MDQPAVVFEGVSKKFYRGERFDSLRDLIPALVKSAFRPTRGDELGTKEFWALRDVSFEVRPGEALGIIGPNGAGKSTVLKILTRILRADVGVTATHGRVGALVEIAAGFHPDLTGRENVYLQGAIMGMKRAEVARKFDEIVEFAGIAEFIDTPVKRYSSGMNARLGFAVAAHLDPDVLLIDEVLSVGDLSFQEKCYQRMQRFARSGAAVVFVSHNLSAVSSLCTKVMVLRQGHEDFLGPTHEGIGRYATVMDATRSEAGHQAFEIALTSPEGQPVTEVEAGRPLRVTARGAAPQASTYRCELQFRHLETGTIVYRCQSDLTGAGIVKADAGQPVEFSWSVTANLGRGHYAVICALLNARHNWLVASAPRVLTVNERQSQSSMVFLDARCESTAGAATDGLQPTS